MLMCVNVSAFYIVYFTRLALTALDSANELEFNRAFSLHEYGYKEE